MSLKSDISRTGRTFYDGMGDAVNSRSRHVERIEIVDLLNGGFDEPKGGYRYVIVTVQVLNARDGGKDYGESDFTATASDAQRGWDVDRKFLNYSDQPLGSGRLGSEEYAFGQIIFEVHQDTTQIKMQFKPSLFGDSGYWVLDIQ